MKIRFTLIALLQLTYAWNVFGADAQPLSENESSQIKQRLEAYERGTISFDEMAAQFLFL